MNIAIEGHPAEHLGGTFISANAFSLLRKHPIVGRDFRLEDDRAGAEPVVIIGHAVWIGRHLVSRQARRRCQSVDSRVRRGSAPLDTRRPRTKSCTFGRVPHKSGAPDVS
jgi:hypothetical protein